VRTRDHFLSGVAALGKRNRLEQVEIEHLGDEFTGGRLRDHRQACAHISELPGSKLRISKLRISELRIGPHEAQPATIGRV